MAIWPGIGPVDAEPERPVTLHVHRAERTDLLADELAHLLAQPPADPFAPEVVAVPTKGVERFLAQRLALHLGAGPHGDGVCANVLFPSPGTVLDGAIARAAGRDPASDPWRPHMLPWRIAAVVSESLDEAWALPMRVLLRDEPEGPSTALWNRDESLGNREGPLGDGQEPLGDPEGLLGRPQETGAVSAPAPSRQPGSPWRGNGRLMALSGRLAELFTTYDLERPAMIRAWAAGQPDQVPDDLAWQFHLWSSVRHHLAVPSIGEVLAQACARLTGEPDAVDLPERISLFGPTRIPHAHLAVLQALGEHREVHLWVPDPSPRRWHDILTVATDLESSRSPRRRLTLAARHPLLRSLGRDSAELTYQLGSLAAGRTSRVAPSPKRPQTLLGWLQSDLAADRLPSPQERAERRMRPDDTSLRIHACAGRTRQVEVLREVLLGLLQRDPTLEPRDILVMCPDVRAFAPLVTAAFGADAARASDPARDLRVRIADRTREQLNPVLGVLDQLLTLAVGRFPASAVFDFASLPVVSHRFGWDAEALERIRTLADSAGVRWGLDWEDRNRFVIANGQNTWSAGTDRLLLGVAMGADDGAGIGTVLPVDDVGAGDVAAIGQLAELVDRLRALAPQLRQAHRAAEWHTLLVRALTQLTSTRVQEQSLVTAALGAVGRLLAVDGPGAEVPLGLGDVRQLLAGLLAGRPTRTNFRTGGLTVCSLVPMRSVPHRVVCLLGIDDGVYPRAARVDGNDVLGREPCVGEPDVGAADRQVLLDAVMAATETLVIVHTGADQVTNTRQPPAVPVQELIDAVALTATPPPPTSGPERPQPADAGREVPPEPVEGPPASTSPAPESSPPRASTSSARENSSARESSPSVRDLVVVRHPLQPFDPRNFVPGPAGVGRPFSHDRAALAGARAVRGPREPQPPFVGAPLVEDAPVEVALSDLEQFLSGPPAYFLRARMGLRLRKEDEPRPDEMPVHLTHLERYAVGQRVLDELLRGGEPATSWRAERLRGTVPPGRLADSACEDILPQAERIATVARRWRQGPATEVAVDVVLPSDIRVTGLVPVHDAATVTATFARMKEKYHLHAWARVLALQAAHPGTAFRACSLAAADGGACGVMVCPPDEPAEILDQIVALYVSGLREPLPLTPRSGHQYATLRAGGRSAEQALARVGRDQWDPDAFYRNNDACEEPHMAIWGADEPFARFTAAAPEPDEEDWFADEPTRFGVLARRLWEPLLPCMTDV